MSRILCSPTCCWSNSMSTSNRLLPTQSPYPSTVCSWLSHKQCVYPGRRQVSTRGSSSQLAGTCPSVRHRGSKAPVCCAQSPPCLYLGCFTLVDTRPPIPSVEETDPQGRKLGSAFYPSPAASGKQVGKGLWPFPQLNQPLVF